MFCGKSVSFHKFASSFISSHKTGSFLRKKTLRIHFLGLINCEFEVARGPRNRYSINNSTVSVDKGCPLEMLEI